jgi:hypothetical protein
LFNGNFVPATEELSGRKQDGRQLLTLLRRGQHANRQQVANPLLEQRSSDTAKATESLQEMLSGKRIHVKFDGP